MLRCDVAWFYVCDEFYLLSCEELYKIIFHIGAFGWVFLATAMAPNNTRESMNKVAHASVLNVVFDLHGYLGCYLLFLFIWKIGNYFIWLL
jgi:hypothetical protein